MSAVTDTDGSEDVHDFLMRIRELGDRRDKEDEERTRKLEEEVLQGRMKREARNAERVRSLSPTKSSSNAGTPTSIRSPVNLSRQEDLSKSPSYFQQPAAARASRMESSSNNPQGPRKFDFGGTADIPREPSQPSSSTIAPPNIMSSSATTLSRAGTLSWQQRPLSKGSPGARPRPLSMLAPRDSGTVTPPGKVESPAPAEEPASRDQIVRSLGTKDPSWFRQTQDRGDQSAAYRKQPDEDRSETIVSRGRVHLQGLARGLNAEPSKETSPPAETVRSISPSIDGSTQSKSSLNTRHSTSASLSSVGGFRSPLPSLQSQRFEPPSSDSTSSVGVERQLSRRTLAMSPSQGRISPERMERSSSPTKGLGGFVQSAMLKRSDSVNKRWSAQAGSGLSRQNSIASTRNGYEGSRSALGIVNPTREPKPSSLSRDGSPVSNSRPGSSHSNATLTQPGIDSGQSNSAIVAASSKPDPGENGFAKPALPPLKLSPTITSGHENVDEQLLENTTPASPSKRWSPTKASWLENAIKKPDSPKPKLPPPTQPNWMINRTKGKHDKESSDVQQDRGIKEVAVVGLARSPPPDIPVKSHSVPLLPKRSDGVQTTESTVKKVEKVNELKNPTPEPKKGDRPANQFEPRQVTPSTPKKDPSLPTKDMKPKPRENPISSPTPKDNTRTEPRFGSPSAAETASKAPAQKDFRSNLKSRRASVEKDSKEEIEFKSVFGKLKRTQTQNYVAPDELKDNILRGKAGLATTGGPKKTEHKDEFKESLLKQREAIKAGISPNIPPKPSGRIFSNDRKSPVPEAIAKKEGLARSKSGLEDVESRTRSGPDNPEHSEESNLGKKNEKEKPDTVFEKQTRSRQTEAAADKGLVDPFTSSLAGLLSRGPPTLLGGAKPSASTGPGRAGNGISSSTIAGESETNGRPLIHMTKSRAKGPKRRLPATEKQTDTTEESTSSLSRSTEIKLPKTRAQKSSTGDQSQASSQIRDRSAPRPLASISNNNSRKPSQPPTPRKPSTNVTPLAEAKPTSPIPKPAVQDILTKPATTSPTIKPKAATPTGNALATKRSTPADQPVQVLVEKAPRVDEPLPPKPPAHAPVQKFDHTFQDVSSKMLGSLKAVAGTWGKLSTPDLAQPARIGSPVKPLGHRAEIIPFAEENAKNEGKPKAIGLGIETTSEESRRTAPLDRNLPSPPIKSPQLSHSPKSPPLPGKKPTSIGNRISSLGSPPQSTSQADNSAKSPGPLVFNVLNSYTGEIPNSCPNINIDTQAVLASSSTNENSNKIKTLRKQIWEITGHGKSIPVPSHQEHILFEDSLYLCTHIFGTLNGTRTTEIYLWCGSGVAESAADDAQIFARKVAKEHNGKFLILQQGKETANFFQALGGIVITRRGSSSRGESPSKSASTYMLCGRRHVGQIAFDEVDYSTRSLCKAFPFLISARLGKLYLWKGKGSGVDELGCARLIGMDLGLGGEIEEVEDGHEPDGFWEDLPGGKHGAIMDFQHWHLRPGCEKYVTRLFGIEVEASRPKSSSGFTWRRRESAPPEENAHLVARVREFTPFAQNDMTRDGVYVLDAFFEVFLIIPKPSTPIPSASALPARPAPSTVASPAAISTPHTRLRASLIFAQEYAILAASLEDRPFVPSCTVVFLSGSGGPNDSLSIEPVSAPEGIRSAFRKWEDGTGARTVMVLPLSQVLEAVGAVRGA